MSSSDYIAALPAKRMAASVVFVDERHRVLIVEPTYKDHWEIPGGAVDADESPYASAVREIDEELGLDHEPGRLLAVDWVPPTAARTEGLTMVFDGGLLGPSEIAALTVPADELRGFAFCTPGEAAERLSPLLARRMAAAVTARESGTTAYLENGIPLT